MNANFRFAPLVSLSALLVVSSAAIAADPAATATTARSRASVVSETLAARAAGMLAPAGELSAPWQSQGNAPSTLTRSAVASQVLVARTAGALVPAGEGDQAVAILRTTSTVARAEVKASVIAARKAGELVPAGEALDDEIHARAKTSTLPQTAAAGAIAMVANQ